MKRLTFYLASIFFGITLSFSAQAQEPNLTEKFRYRTSRRDTRVWWCQFSLYWTGTCISSNGWTFYPQ